MSENINKTTKFSKSIGAGMKSVFNPSGREFYILEYKDDSKRHKKGDKQEVIVDYVELGRDSKCLVQYDESYSTVSRVHAAITKEGNNWKLMHLSKTNPTLINGKPVGKEWYLQDGDEIQLSYEGPKIVFIIPLNNNTGTLGLSHRMTLFRQQALRPYKTTILILSMVLVIAVASLVYWNFENEKTWKNKFDQTTYEMDSLREALVKESKRVIMLNEENLSLKESSDREINYLKKQQEMAAIMAKQQQERINTLESQLNPDDNPVTNDDVQVFDDSTESSQELQELQAEIDIDINVSEIMASCSEALRYIYMNNIDMIYDENGKEQIIDDPSIMSSGMAFYGDNGRLYTSRSIVEPWFYFNENDNNMRFLNMFDVSMGSVISTFTTVSIDQEAIQINSQAFNINRSKDIEGVAKIKNRGEFAWKKADIVGESNWAYSVSTNELISGLTINKEYIPKQDDVLYFFTYPEGIGPNIDGIYPSFYNTYVAVDNTINGFIITDDIGDVGNVNGSPVIYIDSNSNASVVGLIVVYGNNTMFVHIASIE